MTARIAVPAALGLALASACIGTSPEQAAREELPNPYDDDGDAEHRPGQPCLVCHGADYHPGEEVFVLAGTVFPTPGTDARDGMAGVSVEFVDDAGHEFHTLSNRAGNFMISVDEDLSAPRTRRRGGLAIPWQPVFPVRVAVSYGNTYTEMESLIWREGSCAACHTGVVGPDSVDRIFLQENR